MKQFDDHWSLPELLDRMPAPGEAVTDGRPYLREEASGEYVVRGVGYLPVMARIRDSFRAAGFPEVGQTNYQTYLAKWIGKHPPSDPARDLPEPAQVAIMSRQDCFNLLRFIERQERFGDGTWTQAHRIGWFHAIAVRLVVIDGGEKVDPGSSPG